MALETARWNSIKMEIQSKKFTIWHMFKISLKRAGKKLRSPFWSTWVQMSSMIGIGVRMLKRAIRTFKFGWETGIFLKVVNSSTLPWLCKTFPFAQKRGWFKTSPQLWNKMTYWSLKLNQRLSMLHIQTHFSIIRPKLWFLTALEGQYLLNTWRLTSLKKHGCKTESNRVQRPVSEEWLHNGETSPTSRLAKNYKPNTKAKFQISMWWTLIMNRSRLWSIAMKFSSFKRTVQLKV
jgi:hypothetical protein